jgi:hypothetical protein
MKPRLLIRTLVRQCANLVAVAATLDGRRTPLGTVLDQFFADLVDALARQGLRRKVIADMLGITPRTFYARLRKLEENGLEPGRTLWQDVLRFIRERGRARRDDILKQFSTHDEAVIRSVLRDLTDSELVYQAGTGLATRYLAAPDTAPDLDTMDVLTSMAHAVVENSGPVSLKAVADQLGYPADVTEETLTMLEEMGAVARVETATGPAFTARRVVVLDDRLETATLVFFQSLQSSLDAAASGNRGPAAVTVDLWAGHPLTGAAEELVMAATTQRQVAPSGVATRRLVIFLDPPATN